MPKLVKVTDVCEGGDIFFDPKEVVTIANGFRGPKPATHVRLRCGVDFLANEGMDEVRALVEGESEPV